MGMDTSIWVGRDKVRTTKKKTFCCNASCGRRLENHIIIFDHISSHQITWHHISHHIRGQVHFLEVNHFEWQSRPCRPWETRAGSGFYLGIDHYVWIGRCRAGGVGLLWLNHEDSSIIAAVHGPNQTHDMNSDLMQKPVAKRNVNDWVSINGFPDEGRHYHEQYSTLLNVMTAMDDSSDEDDWCPKTQVGLQDSLAWRRVVDSTFLCWDH